MKKKLIILPVLAALFAACTSDDLVVDGNQGQQNEQDGAIAFDAYLNRAVTRAGTPGNLTTNDNTSPNVSLQEKGFGVFAYYADGDLYSENAIPNFMYNQQVKWDGGTSVWTYSPIKYWPNEFGSSAISTGVDRVTFFAYAPWVGVDPTTGQLTTTYDDSEAEKSTVTGITALTRNGKAGDPYVRYVGAFEPANCVDLCYGVAAGPDPYTSSVGALDGANNIEAGKPYINVAKPEIESKLKFNFKHALAKLIVTVDADVDLAAHGDADALDGKTRIWVRSITFDGVAQRGYLNLNNGIWYDVIESAKISHASVTVHDGRRDGAEALVADSYETPIGLNPALIQSVAYTTTEAPDPVTGVPTYTAFSTSTTGVTAASLPLFGTTNHDLLVIPANEPLKVTIVYDVETADATLPKYLSDGTTKGSTVENKITKSITLDGKALKLESGNKYTLNLHLGMTSVKFDADVSGWDDATTADNTWLPENAKVLAAGSTESISVPVEGGTYTYKITGLTASSTKTPASTVTGDGFTPTWTDDDPASSGILTFTIPANTSVSKQTGNVTLTESGVATPTTITVTQTPAPLGLGVSAVSTNTITLSKLSISTEPWSETGKTKITDATTTYEDGTSTVKRIQVKKGGSVLTDESGSGDPSATGKFTFNASAGTIKLYDAIVAGDEYTITVKAGDADPETFVAKIGAISYASTAVPIVKGTTDFTNTLTKTGTGTIIYTITGAAATINSGTGAVNVGATNGTATVTATVADDPENGWYYLTNTATYTLNIGDVVFSNASNYNWACTKDAATCSIVVSGLTASGSVSVAETTDANNISSGEAIKAGANGSGTVGAADANGIAQLSTTLTANSDSEKTAVLTITDGGNSMTVTIKQAYE